MRQDRIIRTVCVFAQNPDGSSLQRLDEVVKKMEQNNFQVQTKRIASTIDGLDGLAKLSLEGIEYASVGALNLEQSYRFLPAFYADKALSFNIDLASAEITETHGNLLQEIIKTNAYKTFNFAYTFNNAPSSPYFPSAKYEKDGFVVGLQPTDLSGDCNTLEEWLNKMEQVWREIAELFIDDQNFLGIDSSIAPLFKGNSSFVNFVRKLGYTFEHSVTTDMYTKITKHIKEQNPKPIGLCGMMLPCLEDFELATEYENGNFSIERNVYLSLHSGLGIDTYPIGIDEKPERVIEILKLLQSLSNKYNKPMSARFVSDGKAKINDRSDFQNQYLRDCIIRAL